MKITLNDGKNDDNNDGDYNGCDDDNGGST